MSSDQLSAQATEPQAQATEGEGIQQRINELTAKARQAEEALRAREHELMEQSAKMAELAYQAQQRQAVPAPAPVDPLAQFKDQLDPVAAQAIQAAVAETRRQMEAQYAPMFAQQAAQIAGFAVQSEAAAIPNLPKEVINRATQLAAQWRANNLPFPPSDAISFALGEYQRGALLRAAPVAGYNPAAQPAATFAGVPPQPAAARSALPADFETKSRNEQNAILERSGLLDSPL